jgi:hypothetical protein
VNAVFTNPVTGQVRLALPVDTVLDTVCDLAANTQHGQCLHGDWKALVEAQNRVDDPNGHGDYTEADTDRALEARDDALAPFVSYLLAGPVQTFTPAGARALARDLVAAADSAEKVPA